MASTLQCSRWSDGLANHGTTRLGLARCLWHIHLHISQTQTRSHTLGPKTFELLTQAGEITLGAKGHQHGCDLGDLDIGLLYHLKHVSAGWKWKHPLRFPLIVVQHVKQVCGDSIESPAIAPAQTNNQDSGGKESCCILLQYSGLSHEPLNHCRQDRLSHRLQWTDCEPAYYCQWIEMQLQTFQIFLPGDLYMIDWVSPGCAL